MAVRCFRVDLAEPRRSSPQFILQQNVGRGFSPVIFDLLPNVSSPSPDRFVRDSAGCRAKRRISFKHRLRAMVKSQVEKRAVIRGERP
jgi:hypothetical protein